MTPEEKLLALIQQDKRQAGEAARPQVAASQPVVVAAAGETLAPGPKTIDPTPAVSPRPVVPAPVSVARVEAPQAEADTASTRVEPVRESAPVVISAPAPVAPPSEAVPAAKPEPAPVVPPQEPRAQSLKLKKQEPTPVAVVPVPVVVASEETTLAAEPKTIDSEKSEPPSESGSKVYGPKSMVSSAEAVQPKGSGPVRALVAVVPVPLPGPAFPRAATPSSVFLNRGLAIAAVVLIVALYYSVASAKLEIRKELDRLEEGAGQMALSPVVVSDAAVPPLDACLEKIKARNPFIVMVRTEDGTLKPPSEAVEAPKDLKLVGVSIDPAAPQESMAIIRNKVDSKTVFVKVGQPVGGTGYVLSRVLADRAILKMKTQEFELK